MQMLWFILSIKIDPIQPRLIGMYYPELIAAWQATQMSF